MLGRVHVGLGEEPHEARVLPRHVVVAATRLVDVRDAVEVAVPPAVTEMVGERVPTCAENLVDRRGRVHVLGEGSVEVEE